MTFHGTVNCVNQIDYNVVPATSYNQAITQAYAFLFNALSTSEAESVGIYRRAYNSYWSLFEFTNAIKKFWVYITYAPGYIDYTSTTASTVGISIAMKEDGTSPWTGSTNNNGSDSESSPKWSKGTSRLAVFPILNEERGQRVSTKDACYLTFTAENISTSRLFTRVYHHIVFSEDSLTFISSFNRSAFCDWFYFGNYAPSNSSIRAPYCCMVYNARLGTGSERDKRESLHGNDVVKFGSNLRNVLNVNNTETEITTSNNLYCGGILDPLIWRASRMAIIRPKMVYDRKMVNGGLHSSLSNRIDAYNIGLYLDEYESRGYVGEVENIKIVHSLNNGCTLNDKEYAVFGQLSRASKLAFRWGAPVPPGGSANTQGYSF